MGKKAEGDHTPEHRAAIQREDAAKKAVASLDPRWRELQEAEAERLRLLESSPHLQAVQERLRLRKSSPYWQDGQERIRLLAEKLGKAETESQEPTPPQRKPRKPGGGNKPKLSKEIIENGKKTYRGMLDDHPTWAKDQEASAKRVIELLKLGNSVSVWTVKRWLFAPVRKEREQNKRGSYSAREQNNAALILLAGF